MAALRSCFFADVAAVQDVVTPVSIDSLTLEETRRKAENCVRFWRVRHIRRIAQGERAAALLWLHTRSCSIWNTGIIRTD